MGQIIQLVTYIVIIDLRFGQGPSHFSQTLRMSPIFLPSTSTLGLAIKFSGQDFTHPPWCSKKLSRKKMIILIELKVKYDDHQNKTIIIILTHFYSDHSILLESYQILSWHHKNNYNFYGPSVDSYHGTVILSKTAMPWILQNLKKRPW